jgi:chromosome partitioning protein
MRKGGSGKTTTTVNLAAALAVRGKKTLLVDLDPQANATVAIGINPLEVRYHVGDLLADPDLDPRHALYSTSYGLYILPSHVKLANSESGMKATDLHAFRSMIKDLAEEFDYVLVDTPPSESMLTANAMAFANEVIIPLQAHYFAMEGLAQALEQVEKVKKGINEHIKVIGILPTMVNARTNISKSVIDAATSAYPDLVYPFTVDYSVRHPEATLAGVPIVLYDPEHSGALAYKKLAEAIDG